MKPALVFCEGYQDRSFLNAWLDSLGCQKAEAPFTAPKGTYWKRSVGGREIAIIPVGGFAKMAQTVKDVVKAVDVDSCLLVVDTDDSSDTSCRSRRDQMTEAVKNAQGLPSNLEVVCWVPQLETQIENALRACFADRMEAVDAFLKGRPAPPKRTGKEAAFTYCAAWEPDSFGEDFFGWVWREAEVARTLSCDLAEVGSALQRLLAPSD